MISNQLMLETESSAGARALQTRLSLDPAAYPMNPRAKLAKQKSQFADLLTFKGERVNIKDRVGADGYNPFLEEIEERLRNPEARAALL